MMYFTFDHLHDSKDAFKEGLQMIYESDYETEYLIALFNAYLYHKFINRHTHYYLIRKYCNLYNIHPVATYLGARRMYKEFYGEEIKWKHHTE